MYPLSFETAVANAALTAIVHGKKNDFSAGNVTVDFSNLTANGNSTLTSYVTETVFERCYKELLTYGECKELRLFSMFHWV